jgi:glycosyltransferase involved in cell wall biosynthesis
MNPAISIIVPILNEAGNIEPLFHEIKKHCPLPFELIWVDDGSEDNSMAEVERLAKDNIWIKAISFSRTFGHQSALLAGMQLASADIIIIMDGDLQHPPSLLPTLISKFNEGYDLVSAKRMHTASINPMKKWASSLFYGFLNFIADTRIEENVADFRIFNRKVLKSILSFEERELFLRGIFSWIGFKTTTVSFEAPARSRGRSKYSWSKMAGLGLKGVLSFSFKPLRISLLIGVVISLAAFCFAIFAMIAHLNGRTVEGWTSIIIAVMLFGGIQLMAIGLLGEYVARLFTETKKRPLFLINKKININDDV